ncbi:phytanoyl-CoA dioxygenase family protein [Thalassospira sp. TSL5-1]|uniref:phytanoyl-CoA dioxygenase family protein n=1 Tax=Thalassospira sp. TSL5-1 TaxID=1544451 RepID=UPI0009FA5456|nr:phytanoyl-CoA dioxygenase family protein [Thalassospira sp. TSL5-1]
MPSRQPKSNTYPELHSYPVTGREEAAHGAGYYREAACSTDDLLPFINRETRAEDVPHAREILRNVPVYDGDALRQIMTRQDQRRAVMAEWARVMLGGAGVLVIKAAYADCSVLDDATRTYLDIIADEKAANGTAADHFAKAGANDRIWNSAQKLCLCAPDVFARYFGNPVIDMVCEAWLGPCYQMTAQVNLVRPGGQAQQVHRDYHLGFQTAEMCEKFPAHVHHLSPVLTLQGAVAHCDMPLESGPTLLLPFSQLYREGYMAWRRQDFRNLFHARHVQLPLVKGDALFFNPALFHAAGRNSSQNIQRMANLLQVSSAYGRAMESLDRIAMCKAVYPVLRAMQARGTMTEAEQAAAIAACAEGYSFPTNLDTDPPVGGLAPETQNQLFHRALGDGLTADQFNSALDALCGRQMP